MFLNLILITFLFVPLLMYCVTRIFQFVRQTKKKRKSRAKMSEKERTTDCSGSERPKLQKKSMSVENENRDCGSISGSTSGDQMVAETMIFTMNADCFDLIFDYLSIIDLHSFGQTCKPMQQLAGQYFQRNFKSSEKFSGNNGILTVYSDNNGVMNQRTLTSGFNRFINYFSHYYEDIEPLRYIQRNCDEFKSLNHIYLVCLRLDSAKIQCLRQLLTQLEIVQIRQCTIDGDFYDGFLKFCKNLKRIFIQDDLGYILDENRNPWLLHEYAHLEHLQLIPRYSFKINELNRFFELNPQIQCFSTSSRCLWENRQELIKSNVKLDKLEIQILDNYHRHLINMQSICNLLNEFYESGFYRRLYLYVKRVDKNCSEHVITLHALKMLSIRQFTECYSLSQLSNLKELEIMNGANLKDLEILASELENLERLSLSNIKADDILPFVRCSPKLYRIQANFNEHSSLNLYKLNVERIKLAAARKIIIYVSDHLFLATKWTQKYGVIDLDLIEMRRASQC